MTTDSPAAGLAAQDVPGDLHKTLTVGRGIGVSISMIVGSGLLVLPGLAYAEAGSSAVWAWVLAAAVVLPLLVVFATLGSAHPNAGGVVGFTRVAFGRAGAAAIAYVLLGACAFGGAAMALTGGNYVGALVGQAASGPAALVYLAVVCVLNALGSRLAGGVQTAVTVLLVVLIAVVALVPFVDPGFTAQGEVTAPDSLTGLLPTVGLVFFAFTGWELVASTTEEYRNPKRDLPIAVGASFVVIVLLYVGVAAAVQVAVSPDDDLLQRAPLVGVLQTVLGDAAASAASLLGCLIIFATLMGGVWATSRIAFATARERLLPRRLTQVDPQRGAPTAAVILSVLMFGAVVAAQALDLIELDVVFRLSAACFVVGYVTSVAAYAVLFRRWWHRVVALVAAVPILVVTAGFGWVLLYPLALLAVGVAAHRLTRSRSALPVPDPEPAG